MSYTFPSVSPGDILLHTLVGSCQNQTIMNTFWYINIGNTGPVPDIAGACSSFDAYCEGVGKLHAKYRAAMPDNFLMVARWTQIIAPIRYIKFITEDSRAGTGLGPADTANIAAVYERRSGTAGRQKVGTVHLLCPTNNDAIEGGLLTGAQRINVQDVATQNGFDVVTADGSTWAPILYRRPKLSPPVPSAVSNIYDCSALQRVRVMRRRTVGLGI